MYLVSVSWRLSVCRCHFYQQEFLRIWPSVQCSVVSTVTVSECGGGGCLAAKCKDVTRLPIHCPYSR